jgi:hypothetical protein
LEAARAAVNGLSVSGEPDGERCGSSGSLMDGPIEAPQAVVGLLRIVQTAIVAIRRRFSAEVRVLFVSKLSFETIVLFAIRHLRLQATTNRPNET